MDELIKYFEALEARIAANEAKIAANDERISGLEAELASLEAELDELKSQPAAEPRVVEKVVEKIVEKPVVVPAPVVEEPEPKVEEPASPKAAVYGKAVDDIRLAISLGDRFLYQRELFGQNAELMQRTLTELNELNSFDEALAYISKFNWDTESNTYQQFLVTLHRRFG